MTLKTPDANAWTHYLDRTAHVDAWATREPDLLTAEEARDAALTALREVLRDPETASPIADLVDLEPRRDSRDALGALTRLAETATAFAGEYTRLAVQVDNAAIHRSVGSDPNWAESLVRAWQDDPERQGLVAYCRAVAPEAHRLYSTKTRTAGTGALNKQTAFKSLVLFIDRRAHSDDALFLAFLCRQLIASPKRSTLIGDISSGRTRDPAFVERYPQFRDRLGFLRPGSRTRELAAAVARRFEERTGLTDTRYLSAPPAPPRVLLELNEVCVVEEPPARPRPVFLPSFEGDRREAFGDYLSEMLVRLSGVPRAEVEAARHLASRRAALTALAELMDSPGSAGPERSAVLRHFDHASVPLTASLSLTLPESLVLSPAVVIEADPTVEGIADEVVQLEQRLFGLGVMDDDGFAAAQRCAATPLGRYLVVTYAVHGLRATALGERGVRF